jgi:hypothetical protein
MTQFHPEDQPRDVFDELATQLLAGTGAISLIVDGMYEGISAGWLATDVNVPTAAREMFAAILAEHLGTRYTEADVGAAASVIEEALETIVESLCPLDGRFECEGRRHIGPLNARRP